MAVDTWGTILRRKGQLEASITAHRRAVTRNPDIGELHYNLALALRKAGRRQEAEEHFRRARELGLKKD